MHKRGMFHRDIKPENILLTNEVVKLADFGSSRAIRKGAQSTQYVSTRWYRSPECLLTEGGYSYKMDIWSIGCMLFELLAEQPLFSGSDELDQIN